MEARDIISSGLLELYVSGLASPDEELKVMEWSDNYPEVKHELQAIQLAMENYAMASAVQPDPSIKEKILSRIGNSGTIQPQAKVITLNHKTLPSGVSRVYKYIAAASIILLLATAAVGFDYYSKYTDASNHLQVAEQQATRQKLLAEVMHKELDTISDKSAHPVVLNGTPHAPDAVAKIYWMKDKGGSVWVDPSNLPQIPAGYQYQLWAIIDGKPVNAGMIETGNGIFHIQKMKSFGRAEAFAITMEKSGGSAAPTMDEMVVMSKI